MRSIAEYGYPPDRGKLLKLQAADDDGRPHDALGWCRVDDLPVPRLEPGDLGACHRQYLLRGTAVGLHLG